MCIAIAVIVAATAQFTFVAADTTHPAQGFRANGEPVVPTPDGTIFCEAEELQPVAAAADAGASGWQARPWGENYYAATFANCFLSRKAFLGAPEDCDETVATINVEVKDAGRYLVLARYEAAYRFETQFRLKVEQGGEVKLNRLYGARDNLKIWAFSQKIKKEVAWGWGAVENIVWEGHDTFVDLRPGLARISLIAGPQPAPQAKRNVDLIMLTRDVQQVQMRIDQEGYLPLDGWLTQAGDVYLKATNTGQASATVKSLNYPGGPFQQHSPYWIHIRNWKPISVDIEPGHTTDWIEVGSTMDSLNDGQWGFESSGLMKLELGLRNAAGQIEAIRTFKQVNGSLPLVGFADVRYSRRIWTFDEANADLANYLKAIPARGRAPSLIRVYANSALPKPIYDLFGLNGSSVNGPSEYVWMSGQDTAQLEQTCNALSDEQRRNIYVVSLGDEIGLPAPDQQAASEGFVNFLKAQALNADDVDPTAGNDWSKIVYNPDPKLRNTDPGRYYWSRRYLHHYGIQDIKQLTDVLRANLPNAHIGANFSPHAGEHAHAYLGHVFQWITCFREEGMTLPWSEDYIWQVPVGSPQMNSINLDMFRAGNRHRPERRIHYYVMPHSPGNTPAMWRRLFHNALGHGMTMVNLFGFDPVWVASTENHVTGNEMYGMVLRTLRELSFYEDVVEAGHVRPAQTGLWFSEAADVWADNESPFGAAKRGMYITILGQQLPLDIVVEQDALDGTLNQYKALYLTDRHVSRAASGQIAKWVGDGGKLMATAGAGMFDEYNQPNTAMRKLLGVEMTALVAPPEAGIGYIKEDVAFAKLLETVSWSGRSFEVFSAISRIKAAPGAQVSGVFSDQSPAVVTTTTGRGATVYCAFLPSLSYFRPAIPIRPLDRGATDDAMSHFIPKAFDWHVGALVGSIAADVDQPVVCSERLVEANVIESKVGTIIVLTNWSGGPIKDLTVELNIDAPAKAELAGGGAVTAATHEGKRVYTLDLDVADVLILR